MLSGSDGLYLSPLPLVLVYGAKSSLRSVNEKQINMILRLLGGQKGSLLFFIFLFFYFFAFSSFLVSRNTPLSRRCSPLIPHPSSLIPRIGHYSVFFCRATRLYVCVYGHHLKQSRGQPDKVASPTRGLLNRKYEYEVFPCSVRASEFGLARRVWPSCSALGLPFSTLRLNLVTGFRTLSAASIYLYCQPPWGQSRDYQVTRLRTDGVHCRESAGTGPEVLR